MSRYITKITAFCFPPLQSVWTTISRYGSKYSRSKNYCLEIINSGSKISNLLKSEETYKITSHVIFRALCGRGRSNSRPQGSCVSPLITQLISHLCQSKILFLLILSSCNFEVDIWDPERF